MSRDLSDAQRLRIVDDDRHRELSQADNPPPGGTAARVAQITGAGYASAFNAVTFQSITGTETAGSTGTLASADSGFAYNLGGTAPAAGTNVLCRFVAYRWTFRFD